MGRDNLCIFSWQTPVPFSQVPEAGKSTEEPMTSPLEAPSFIQMDLFQWNILVTGWWNPIIIYIYISHIYIYHIYIYTHPYILMKSTLLTASLPPGNADSGALPWVYSLRWGAWSQSPPNVGKTWHFQGRRSLKCSHSILESCFMLPCAGIEKDHHGQFIKLLGVYASSKERISFLDFSSRLEVPRSPEQCPLRVDGWTPKGNTCCFPDISRYSGSVDVCWIVYLVSFCFFYAGDLPVETGGIWWDLRPKAFIYKAVPDPGRQALAHEFSVDLKSSMIFTTIKEWVDRITFGIPAFGIHFMWKMPGVILLPQSTT